MRRDYVLTDWEQVDAFAESILRIAGGARAAERLGLAPEPPQPQPQPQPGA